VNGTVLPVVPVLSWLGAYLSTDNLYLVLRGLLFGVLGLLVISFYVSCRAVDFQCQAFRHAMYILLGVSFEMWNRLLWRELPH
jgi:hypothetical protein